MEPSPEFLTFAQAQVEILPSHKGRGNDLFAVKNLFTYSPNPLFTKTLNNLSTHPLIHLSTSKKAAFTLAEVLITLGIIGVVAAITIPGLIANYQKQQTATHLKRVYSLLSQAVRASEQDNEEVSGWDYKLLADDFVSKYLVQYIKLDKVYNYFDIKGLGEAVSYSAGNAKLGGNTSVYMLLSGEILYVSTSMGNNGQSIRLRVDLNGAAKPNMIGKDIFTFSICPDYGFTLGSDRANENARWAQNRQNHKNRQYLLSRNYGTCNKSALTQFGFAPGDGCALLISLDGWKIADDYPWK